MKPAEADDAQAFAATVERAAYRQRLDAFLASREAGSQITLDALRAGITLTAVVDAAADVAAFTDEAQAIVSDQYRPPLHCKAGCSYCCCKPGVLTSIPEFLRVLSYVESTFDDPSRAALGERAERYALQIRGRHFDDPTNESVPCPLLVEGRCSVYEVRPLVCRGYNSTNVESCRKAHDDINVQVPIFSVLKDVTDGATVGAGQALASAGLTDAMIDLGSGLNLVFTAGAESPASLLEDSSVFSTARNRTWVADLWREVQATAQRLGLNLD